MRNDHTGVPHTCPIIDECIGSVDSAIDTINQLLSNMDAKEFDLNDWKNDLYDQSEKLTTAFNGRNSMIEKVRSANSELRDVATAAMKDVNDRDNDIYYLNVRVKELEIEVADKNDTIKVLEKQLEEANDIIDNQTVLIK